MEKIRHVLGISGGKDSAALAIYMFENYPQLELDYYTCDTGKELQETYDLIDNLENYLGKKIALQKGTKNSPELPFDHFLKIYGGYLPSSMARWCTKKLKLEPFEDYVGNDPVVSYVGIRGDEEREGYISRKSNIQSIFPFRKNIWSEDVIVKALANANIPNLINYLSEIDTNNKKERFEELLLQPLTGSHNQQTKMNLLLDTDIKVFNRLIFRFLKTTDYPLSKVDEFPLIENDQILVRADIFKLLEKSGVGIPAYYKPIEFEVNGKKATYARSRSGCFFCFFQQKIEWVWLFEQHNDLFLKALEYEKDGYTWSEEPLAELMKPERILKIKEDYIKRSEKNNKTKKSSYLLDILSDSEGEGCAACFI
ncbi:MAG: phosphoadenosine phosphosulfate reductase [Bacteroidota bacterium]|jgi:3'-phosphoadenosine 5'-phosphosulfate sulfotransferase (PAPS reductase)/FAD synthetase|nr:phosphoadenosine phosphosulfate reductase [Bacteroidota bacterium]